MLHGTHRRYQSRACFSLHPCIIDCSSAKLMTIKSQRYYQRPVSVSRKNLAPSSDIKFDLVLRLKASKVPISPLRIVLFFILLFNFRYNLSRLGCPESVDEMPLLEDQDWPPEALQVFLQLPQIISLPHSGMSKSFLKRKLWEICGKCRRSVQAGGNK